MKRLRPTQFFLRVIFFSTLFAAGPAYAANTPNNELTITLPADISLAAHAQYYQVTDRAQNYAQISAAPATAWASTQPGDRARSSKIWVKLDFNTGELTSQRWYLWLAYSVDHVELYTTINGTLVATEITGVDHGFHDRPIEHPDFLLPLELENHAAVALYLAFNRPRDAAAGFRLVEREQFFLNERPEKYRVLFLFGGLVMMALYNLFLFISVRDRAYLFFALAIGFLSVGILSMQGIGYQLFWPNVPWIQQNYQFLTMTPGHLFNTLFCISFLRTRRFSRAAHTLLITIAVGHGLLILFSVLFYFPRPVYFPFLIFTYVSFLGVGFYAWYKRIPYAPFFTLAWLATSAAIFALASLRIQGTIEGTLPLYLLRALVLETLLLSFALGYRIKTLQQLKIKEKSEFLARISHEMRTPLNGILSALPLLDPRELAKKNRVLLNLIDQSATRLNEIVGDLLDFAETSKRPAQLETTTNDFRAFIADIHAAFREDFDSKGLLFCVCVAPGIPERLQFDAYRLRTALSALLDNSQKFSQRGYVTLSVTQLPAQNETSVRLRFSLRDTGTGIETEQLATIFDAFKQAQPFYSRDHDGLGLGLSIAAQNLAAMGGTIQVESVPGNGSHFYFDLELAYCDDAADTGTEHAYRGLSILLVEDNPVNQTVTRKMLENYGHHVDLASNGVAGVDKALRNHYDLVLMDCSMPVKNGFDATREIRAAGLNQLPVIALTANVMEGDREKCLRAGMDDYVGKPVKLPVLLAAIDNAIAKYAAVSRKAS